MARSRILLTLALLAALLVDVHRDGTPPPADAQEDELHATHLTAFADDADCQTSAEGTTRYFVTLVSSSGQNIPSFGGTPATVTLIGTGTQNAGQTVAMAVGDLESQALDGRDVAGGTVENPPGSGAFPNGSCNDLGDQAPLPNDGHANDYGSPFVSTSPPGTNLRTWRLHITAPGHVAQLVDLTALVDGIPPTVAFPGTGCRRADRGCLFSLGTITLQALSVPAAGRGSIAGTVTDAASIPLGGVEVVLFRHLNQDPFDNAPGPIPEHSGFSVLTGANGQFFVNDLFPGTYSVTVADTRFPTSCAPSAACGIQPATKQGQLTAGLQAIADFGVPTDVQLKQAPGQAVAGNQVGVFGYVVDGVTGFRIGGSLPGFTPTTITFTPASGSGAATVTAIPDTQGRYQALLIAGFSYTASASFPPGYFGACTAGGNSTVTNIVGSSTPLFPCAAGAPGTDRFTFPAPAGGSGQPPALAAPSAGQWNDGATFILLPAAAPASNQTPVPVSSPTPTLPAVGGRGLTLAGGTGALQWAGGLQQTGYLVLRWSPTSGFAFLPSPTTPLPANTTSLTDPGPLPDTFYCYMALALGGNPPSVNQVLGRSDLLCRAPRSNLGTPPSQLSIRLDQTNLATLSWGPPGSYTLFAFRPDGSAPRAIPVAATATSATDDMQGQTTCYVLVAQSGATTTRSEAVCAVPGASALPPG